MVVVVKVGRRIHTKGDYGFMKGALNKARNCLSIQQYMWRTIQYGFSVAGKKADIEKRRNKKKGLPIEFTYTKKKYIEREDDIKYNIEWLEIKISGTDDVEEDQYKKSLMFFEKLSKHKILQKYINEDKDEESIDKDLIKAYNPKNKRIRKAIKAGVEGAGEQTLNKFLNEVGIIVYVDKE